MRTRKEQFLDAIKTFPLMLVTESLLCKSREDFLERIDMACSEGVRIVQFREKLNGTSPMMQEAKTILAGKVRATTAKHGALLIVNEDHALARAIHADGIHYPEHFLSQPIMPHGELLGFSVHIANHIVHHADYIIFGNIFETSSKQGMAGKGLPLLRDFSHSTPLPTFAIGGITPNRARACIDNGAAGIAVMSAILQAENISQTIHEFIRALCLK